MKHLPPKAAQESEMKLWLVAVGHKMPDWVSTGFNEYAKRMPREARIELVEIKPEPRTTGKNTAADHGGGGAAHTRRAAAGCAAHRAGRARHPASPPNSWRSRWKNGCSGGRDVAFIIGGADGLHESVKNSAGQLLALSAHDAAAWHGARFAGGTVVSGAQLVAQSPLSP